MLKFETENLGKVRRASIELAPLVILVGKNNTGKSYIASLIWAMSNLNRLIDSELAVSDRPKWFTDFVNSKIDASSTLVIDRAKVEDLIAHINTLLDEGAAGFLSEVFAYEGFEKTKVRVSAHELPPFKISIFRSEFQGEKLRPLAQYAIGPDLEKPWLQGRAPIMGRRTPNWFADRLLTDLIGFSMFGIDWPMCRTPSYIPAARTGLMQAMRALVSHSFEPESGGEVKELPRPLANFLQRLTFPMTARSHSKQNATDWLTEQVIKGAIQSDSAEIADFRYVPE